MRYFKNNKRFTLVTDENEFIEVKQLRTVKSVSTGKNELICNDAKEFDVEIKAEEFFEQCEKVVVGFSEKIIQLADRAEKEKS